MGGCNQAHEGQSEKGGPSLWGKEGQGEPLGAQGTGTCLTLQAVGWAEGPLSGGLGWLWHIRAWYPGIPPHPPTGKLSSKRHPTLRPSVSKRL